jgi:hypothetical protein
MPSPGLDFSCKIQLRTTPHCYAGKLRHGLLPPIAGVWGVNMYTCILFGHYSLLLKGAHPDQLQEKFTPTSQLLKWFMARQLVLTLDLYILSKRNTFSLFNLP